MTPPFSLRRDVEGLEALRERHRRLLAVFAHPDDESYGCAGALARAGADPDAAAVLLCLTNGEASSTLAARGLAPDQVAAVREARLVSVAERLGLSGLVLPRLPDGRLARRSLAEVAGVVARVVEAFRPNVVVTQDARGVNGHPDHIAAHWAVRHAREQCPSKSRLAMVVYLAEAADAVRPRLLFPTPPEEVDAEVGLTPVEIDAKEDCLRLHEAIVTVRDPGATDRMYRPPIERYDFLDETFRPPVADLFAGL